MENRPSPGGAGRCGAARGGAGRCPAVPRLPRLGSALLGWSWAGSPSGVPCRAALVPRFKALPSKPHFGVPTSARTKTGMNSPFVVLRGGPQGAGSGAGRLLRRCMAAAHPLSGPRGSPAPHFAPNGPFTPGQGQALPQEGPAAGTPALTSCALLACSGPGAVPWPAVCDQVRPLLRPGPGGSGPQQPSVPCSSAGLRGFQVLGALPCPLQSCLNVTTARSFCPKPKRFQTHQEPQTFAARLQWAQWPEEAERQGPSCTKGNCLWRRPRLGPACPASLWGPSSEAAPMGCRARQQGCGTHGAGLRQS